MTKRALNRRVTDLENRLNALEAATTPPPPPRPPPPEAPPIQPRISVEGDFGPPGWLLALLTIFAGTTIIVLLWMR